MFPTNTALSANVAENVENTKVASYSSPKIFVVGNAAEMIQGPMNYSTVRDGFDRWYAWVHN